MEQTPGYPEEWQKIHGMRSKIVRNARDEGFVDVESQLDIMDPHARRDWMVATISLVSDGFLETVKENPQRLQLTETGTRFAAGAEALSNG